MQIEVEVRRAALQRSFGAAWGSVALRELVLVRLRGEDGVVGHGEAAPLPDYDGITVEDVMAGLNDCAAGLRGSEQTTPAELRARCARLTVVPHALAALDLAAWDLAGLRASEPVWRLLGASGPGPITLNHTVDEADRAGAARAAGWARSAGFTCLKLKVGTGDDAGRLAAVRAAAGPEMAIRLDANGAWSSEEAPAHLRVLAPAGLELCEEPVSGLRAIEEVAGRVAVPVAMDETTIEPGALARRRCRAVCLKVGRCGGISGLLAAAAQARATGYEVYLASALDGPLGIAAALHAAAAIAPDRPCGLATLGLFQTAPPDGLAPAPALEAPSTPGLGAGLEAWYGGL